MKVVINVCVGGFFLSKKAKKMIGMGHAASEWWEKYGDRHDPNLVEVVEELGSEASEDIVWEAFTIKSNLVIREIPDGDKYCIDKVNGKETLVNLSVIPIVCPASIHVKSLYKSLKRN